MKNSINSYNLQPINNQQTKSIKYEELLTIYLFTKRRKEKKTFTAWSLATYLQRLGK